MPLNRGAGRFALPAPTPPDKRVRMGWFRLVTLLRIISSPPHELRKAFRVTGYIQVGQRMRHYEHAW